MNAKADLLPVLDNTKLQHQIHSAQYKAVLIIYTRSIFL